MDSFLHYFHQASGPALDYRKGKTKSDSPRFLIVVKNCIEALLEGGSRVLISFS